jgi:hypothetical protein
LKTSIFMATVTTIERFCAAEGYEVIQTYTEVETAKGADALERRRNSRPR